jgi:hypothetical protein
MDLVYDVMIASIALLAFGQGQSYLRNRTVKKYFRDNGLTYILVCLDSEMKNNLENSEELKKFDKIEILSIDSRPPAEKFINLKLLQTTVREVGIMKYPGLHYIENSQIEGRSF